LGLDVNANDGKGSTPLHVAAQCNQLASALKLVDIGANKDALDGNGKTALDLAPKYNKQLVTALSA
jgi:ankyrin repeat protein